MLMRDASALADHDAHAIRIGSADRHEVDQRHGAVLGFETGFEDQRARPIAPRDSGYVVARRDLEAAMLARAEQRREARI